MRTLKIIVLFGISVSVLTLGLGEQKEREYDKESEINERQPECTLLVRPSPIPHRIMDSIFTCTLWVRGVPSPGMNTWQVKVQFDPSILHIINVIEGDFLRQGGSNTTFFQGLQNERRENLRYPRNGPGPYSYPIWSQRICFGASIMSMNTPPTGNGWLAAMRFRVRGLGTTNVEIDTFPISSTDFETKWWVVGGGDGQFRPVFNGIYNQ